VTRVGGGLAIFLLWGGALLWAKPANAAPPKESRTVHLRIGTRHGPIHLYRPAGYDRRSAGIVVYVHGYYIHVDQAWREHHLAAQFAASKRNALFVVPEAPASQEERTTRAPWKDLRQLITTALERARWREPAGPWVVVGHSGAYRTIIPWLTHDRVRHVILVDALYGNESEFRAWLDRNPANQMTLVVKGTTKWADPFVRALPYAVTVPKIPAAIEDLSPSERAAKLLHLHSQFGHFELITEGKTVPVLLARTPLSITKRGRAQRRR
jgi:hypothetical protein